MKGLLSILRGIDLPPFVVGLARGMAEAAVIGGLMEATILLTSADLGNMQIFLPPLLIGIRVAEGAADHIDPAKKRTPPTAT